MPVFSNNLRKVSFKWLLKIIYIYIYIYIYIIIQILFCVPNCISNFSAYHNISFSITQKHNNKEFRLSNSSLFMDCRGAFMTLSKILDIFISYHDLSFRDNSYDRRGRGYHHFSYVPLLPTHEDVRRLPRIFICIACNYQAATW